MLPPVGVFGKVKAGKQRLALVSQAVHYSDVVIPVFALLPRVIQFGC